MLGFYIGVMSLTNYAAKKREVFYAYCVQETHVSFMRRGVRRDRFFIPLRRTSLSWEDVLPLTEELGSIFSEGRGSYVFFIA
jgi:hypothetical protein|tara:strand:- start:208 stop:453 length:246 start_codon:yes stop_codon:yes gene_type:complete